MASSHGVPRTSIRTGPIDEKLRQKELKQIEEYSALTSKVRTLRSEKRYDDDGVTETSKLLERNPEFYTIWNYRREILLHQFDGNETSPPPTSIDAKELEEESEAQKKKARGANVSNLITEELMFLMPLLMRFPKCYWIWNHRIWLLHQTTSKLPAAASLKFWETELALVGKMLGRDARNFHGWGYRRIVVANVEQLRKQLANDEEEEMKERWSMVEDEFEYTTKMYKTNLSNFSAWHNRSKLIPLLLDKRKASEDERVRFLNGELETMQEAIFTDPFDQSLHLYHHWLVASVCAPKSNTDAFVILPLDKRREILAKEIDWMKELLEDEPECRLLLEELVAFTGFSRQLRNDKDASEDQAEVADTKSWLNLLSKIDPMRKGRWKDIENSL